MGLYRAACLGVFGAFLTSQGHAACPVGQEAFTSCQIAGRNTEVFVCYDDHVVTYGYGPIGQPVELSLSDTVENVDFEPWSGLGKAIHERITFYNGDYSYEVGGGFDRPFSDEEMLLDTRRFGWIDVAQNGEGVSRLECIPETVTYGFGGGIYDAKVAAGLDWDVYSKTWVSVGTDQAPVLRQETNQHDAVDCLPATEFALGFAEMGDRLTAAYHKLGSPEASSNVTLGGHEINRMSAFGIDIDVFQDVVIGMKATQSLWEMPSGLRVGLTRGEVIQILGNAPNGAENMAEKFSALVCLDDQDTFAKWYAVIVFGQDKRVQSISFASLSP